MEIPILIEPTTSQGFRASTGEPLALSAEGNSKEEALGHLQTLLTQRLQNGVELTTLSIGPRLNRVQTFPGIFKEDDPYVKEWIKAMQEYRQQCEDDPDYL